MVSIYTLSDPETNEIRYVGKTCKGVKYRLKRHLDEVKHTYKCRWVQGLKSRGLRPIITEVENCESEEEANKAERNWILTLKLCGVRLTNLTNGGDGGSGRFVSKQTREKMSKAQKGKPSPNKGRTHTDKARENMSKGLIDRWGNNSEYREKTTARLQKQASAGGSSAKLTESKKGRKQSASTIEKRASKIRGSKWSPERRAKIAATWAAKKQNKEG